MLCCIFFSVETVAMHGKSMSLRIYLVGDVVPKAFGSTLLWVVSCRLSRCSHSSVSSEHVTYFELTSNKISTMEHNETWTPLTLA